MGIGKYYQSEGLSAGRLTVREAHGVVALHRGLDMTPGNGVVHGLVLGPGQNIVEIELLGHRARVLLVLGQQLDYPVPPAHLRVPCALMVRRSNAKLILGG